MVNHNCFNGKIHYFYLEFWNFAADLKEEN